MSRLSSCVALVVALHGVVLVWASHPIKGQAQVAARAGHAVQVRWLLQGRADPAVTLNSPSFAEAKAEPQPVSAGGVTGGEPVGQAADPTAQDGDSRMNLDGYVPRRWLTVVPKAVAPIVLPFPESFDERSRYTVVLNLYIEADGKVGRVEFEGVPLPEVLERAARSTFEHARFTPGKVKGRIVKSLIRVEVDFDNLGQG